MPHVVTASAFLDLRAARPELPLFDVRSPQEYARGHMPGALNLPLFSDDERAAVGTVYAREGAEAAVLTGLRIVGPQLADKAARALELAGSGREACMHCWRGGQRSAAMAWLLEQAGFTIHLLRGGYKAYRAQVRADFLRPARLHVLTGMTGSGKTEILLALRQLGAQVIDLEGLASHRGSVFGNVGMPPQPSSEQFENNLHAQWRALNFRRPVWLEDESRRIGNVTICDEFFGVMEGGRRFAVEAPRADRVRRLAALYSAGGHDEALCHAIDVIRKRLGGELHARCLRAVREHDYAGAADMLLEYYDKTYRRSDGDSRLAARLVCTVDDPQETARRLLPYDGMPV